MRTGSSSIAAARAARALSALRSASVVMSPRARRMSDSSSFSFCAAASHCARMSMPASFPLPNSSVPSCSFSSCVSSDASQSKLNLCGHEHTVANLIW
jgi:hypothetical protein